MTRIIALAFVLLLALLSSCGKRKADVLYFNGTIYSGESSSSNLQAFAVRDGRIVSTGSDDDILDGFDAPKKVDLKGRTVLPGFIDAHCHFFGYASDLLKCDLTGSRSYEAALELLNAFSKTNKFSWLLGRGWDQNDWEDHSFPTRERLDSLYPTVPVFLMRIDGHAALCNAVALQLAGINGDTRVAGGEVLLNQSGEPTGLLIDNAVDLVKAKIPPFPDSLNAEALLKAQQHCFSVGLTTVDDAGLGKDSIFLIDRLQQEGKLKLRVYAMISDSKETRDYFFSKGPYKTDRLNVRAVKVYADGALGSRGACLKRPYADQPGHYGFLLHDLAYMNDIMDEAHENGFQVCTHAIGDSAVKTILMLYRENLSGENPRRWRIEHCQVVDPADMDYFSRYSIIPSVQPTHATSDMYWAEERLGKDRMTGAYAYRSLEREAETIAFGTDFPVERINPLLTFYAAVSRKDLEGNPPDGFRAEEAMKRKDVLKAMTTWAAYANFEEEEKGLIDNGYFADFIVLDRNIMEIDEEQIPQTRVLSTYVNGELVYGAE